MRFRPGVVDVKFTLHRDDISPVEEIKEELFKEAAAGNVERAATLFNMLVTAKIFEEMLGDVPRIEDMEIKGTLTV